MTEADARMVRLEAAIEHLEELIAPLPGALNEVIRQSAIAKERIDVQTDGLREALKLLNSHDQKLVALSVQHTETCQFCSNVRQVFWWALGLGCTISGYFILNWFESHKNAKVIGLYLRNLVDLLT